MYRSGADTDEQTLASDSFYQRDHTGAIGRGQRPGPRSLRLAPERYAVAHSGRRRCAMPALRAGLSRSKGGVRGSLDASMACPPGASTLELAPGETTVLTRVLDADTLASFAPGTYGVNVAVTTSTGLIGVWAGPVQLPLASSP